MKLNGIIEKHMKEFTDFMTHIKELDSDLSLKIVAADSLKAKLDIKLEEAECLKKQLRDKDIIVQNKIKEAEIKRSSSNAIELELKERLSNFKLKEAALDKERSIVEKQSDNIRQQRIDVEKRIEALEMGEEKLVLFRKQVDNMIYINKLREQING